MIVFHSSATMQVTCQISSLSVKFADIQLTNYDRILSAMNRIEMR